MGIIVLVSFQVLVRNVPPDPDESVSEHVEHFFCVNHADTYLTHQVCIYVGMLRSKIMNLNELSRLGFNLVHFFQGFNSKITCQ